MPVVYCKSSRLLGAPIPSKGTSGSAGFDLCMPPRGPLAGGMLLAAGDSVRFSTGLQFILPKGWVGLVRGRSGSAFMSGLLVFEGTLDSDYTGEVKLMLYRLPLPGDASTAHSGSAGFDTWHLRAEMLSLFPGDRVAQLVFVPLEAPENASPVEIREVDDEDEWARLLEARGLASSASAHGGFGSTGR